MCSSDLFNNMSIERAHTLLCRDIDVLTDVTDKLVQSSNCDMFGAKFRSPKLRAKA